jgi:aminoglycoside phosphotransferase (APT) family kinase protein
MPTQAIAAYLRANGLSQGLDVRLTALAGGQSNPTFIVDDGTRRFVLRKKPAGQLVASAHAIDREYRVMQALQRHACSVTARTRP